MHREEDWPESTVLVGGDFGAGDGPVLEPETQGAAALSSRLAAEVRLENFAVRGRRFLDNPGVADQGQAPFDPIGRDVVSGDFRGLFAAAVGCEDKAIVRSSGLGPQAKFDLLEWGGDFRIGFFGLCDEKASVGGKTGVEPVASDGAVAIVVERSPYAEAETGEALFERRGVVLDSSELNAHFQVAGLGADFAGQQEDVAVAAGGHEFEPAGFDAPVLHGVGPVIGADPDAFDAGGPVAFEVGGVARGAG